MRHGSTSVLRLSQMPPDTSNRSSLPGGARQINSKTEGSMSLDLQPDLPAYDAITENRSGSTASVCFHNITAMVGAGLLGLPSMLSYLGWAAGMVALVLLLLISWYTFYVLIQLHEEVPAKAQEGMPIMRYNHYQDLSCRAFGPVKGIWVLMPFQVISIYGIATTYAVTGGSNLLSFYMLLGGTVVGLGPWVLVYTGVLLFLAQIPNFSALRWMSGLGAAMSVTYAIIAIILSANNPAAIEDISFNKRDETEQERLFSIFQALTTIAFAYGGHSVSLEIQGTLPAGPYQSTVPRMLLGLNVTFVAAAIMYFGVACTGYAAYGNQVQSNILNSIGQPVWVIATAHMAVVVHVLASYLVYSFILFDLMERGVARVVKIDTIVKRTAIRFTLRTLYVCSTAFIAILAPFFSDLMSLIGAIGVIPTTFVLPSVFWLVLRRPTWRCWEFWINWLIIGVMTVIGFLGAIAAVRNIVLSAPSYETFSGFGGNAEG
eukprot:CAMPEP_0119107552 /NCGR_PEP_ID=MMETSP1180-20130426/11077_1 /TAXON_ID=3052 ORGANISM="Chlamydomonas cf sp, Strain CCMP681" /NCGR_SAMPLE_ID=MMETSP1180 /ASSEMBLY_ACC=CAM_ASM_000741 /LENGTH=487 /DNA_ID=CAMNT_0007093057 /DNA_START=85 /DNA_END=1548 /DNA_ORIENTATION=+